MTFGRFQALALKQEIKTLNAQGHFQKNHSFNYKFLNSSQNKAIFIVKKKLGNAVTRNKIKRRLRAILSISNPSHPIYLMIIVKFEMINTSFAQLIIEFQKSFKKINKLLTP